MKIAHQFCKKLVEVSNSSDKFSPSFMDLIKEFGGKKVSNKNTSFVVIVFKDNSCAEYIKEEFLNTGKIKARDSTPQELLDFLNKEQVNGN